MAPRWVSVALTAFLLAVSVCSRSATAADAAAAATPAWADDWKENRETIEESVAGNAELEARATAFFATVDAAIANGTSDAELTKWLMAFLVELDDDPQFKGFATTNGSSSSSEASTDGAAGLTAYARAALAVTVAATAVLAAVVV